MTPCVLWTGYIRKDGYGQAGSGRRGRGMLVHRKVWAKKHGPIPGKLQIDHICKTRACINIEHMRLVTLEFNAGRWNSEKTMCPSGHWLAGANLYEWGGMRYCRTCRTRHRKASNERLKAAA